MKKLFAAAILLFCPVIDSQASKVPVPQIDYSRFGSYSRQMTVYQNVREKKEQLDRNKYRRFREEARRQNVLDRQSIQRDVRLPRRQGRILNLRIRRQFPLARTYVARFPARLPYIYQL